MAGGETTISRPSCILSIIVLVLMISSTGLLVIVLKGEFAHPHHEIINGSVHHHHHSNHHHATDDLQLSDQGHLPSERYLEEPWRYFKLPDTVIPMHYNLTMEPDLEKATYTGKVSIDVNVTARTRYFVVHAYPGIKKYNVHPLDIQHVSVRSGSNQSDMELEKEFWYPRNDFYVLELADFAEAGIYTLNYEFGGRMDQPEWYGFYRSSYLTSSGETRYLATSKFFSDAAHRAFPCFDEPRFKATFNISLVHRKGEVALSNMPALETELIDTDRYITRFMETVPMSTYITCFIVCDFEYKELITSSGTPIRVYIWPDAINTTTFALQSARGMLEFFEQYFGVNYSLPKLDLIVIPQFRGAASENWGLVTFRRDTLPYDPLESSSIEKQAVAAIVSHELSHMWFGNLVTMEEWKDVWLNEGFASYLENFGVEAMHPDWDIHSYFLIEDFYTIMILEIESDPGSLRPVVPPASLALKQKISKNIGGTFTYKKGASIIRMLEYVLGSENFRKELSNYLKRHEYQNTVIDDLLDELSAAFGPQGNRNISYIVKTWLEQVGFPYVTIKRKSSNSFIAKQRRFSRLEETDHKKDEAEKQKSVWSIPLSYKSSDGQEGIVWIHDEEETEFSLPVKDSDWLKFNVNQTGYYMVNYDKGDWRKLADALLKNDQAMSASDRSNLLFDSYWLSEADHLTIDAFLSLSRYLKKETHPVPWKAFQKFFNELLKMIPRETDITTLLNDYIRYLTSELYEKLGWNTTENHLDNLLRKVIVEMACSSGNQQCLEDASGLFKKWMEGERLPVDTQSTVHRYGMVFSNDLEEWNHVWDKYIDEQSYRLSNAYMESLTSVPSPSLLQRFKNKRDLIEFRTLANLLENPVVQQQAWNYLNNVEYARGHRLIGQYMTSEEEFKQLIKDKNATNYEDILETIRLKQRWNENNLQILKNWLSTEFPAPWFHYRLPVYQVPRHYDLQMHPILEKDLFTGTVAIDVQLLRPSGCLVLHSLDLRLSSVRVTSNTGQKLEVEKFFLYQEHDYVVIVTRDVLVPGLYRLYIEFEGDLKMNLKGLYKSSYVDPETNEKRFLATTQFESTEARRAFPCFDEPRFKTTFNVSIIHDPRHFALSNAIEESTIENENGFLVTKFQETPPMVTYLLAIVVCDFEYIETITANGVRLRTYAAPYLLAKAHYALETGSKILTYYETYFDIPFPLKKLDMIAVPDSDSHGMENWGLITYKEQSLLCGNDTTLETKKPIVKVIAHELAHMWFGDLVTMKWWSDLWLNEGFATHMAYIGAKFAEPELDKNDDQGTLGLVYAMNGDKTLDSHPVVQPVTRVSSDNFDGITYGKGGAILKMLENFMGEDFRIGVSAYLKKYAFGNAETENLWDSLTKASKEGLNVSSLMRTWTHQMNYPYIMVERNSNGANESTYSLQQHQDFESQRHRKMAIFQSSDQYCWQIPVTYRSSHSSEVQRMVLNTTEKVNLTVPDSDWVKLNYGYRGFYSVNYDTQTWKKFIDILEKNHTFFSPSDRLNLLYDALSLSRSGELDFDVSLNLTRYLKREEHPSPLSIGLSLLQVFQNFFSDDTQYIVQEFIRSLSKDLYNKYGWNDTTDNAERELRKILIGAACGSGNRECLQTAGRLFKQWMDEGMELPSNLKDFVYFYGLRVHSDAETWNYVWNRYLNETDPYEEQLLLDNLSGVPNQDILGKMLEYAKDEELVRKHDFFSVVRSISRNKEGGGKALIFRFIDDNWDYLVGKHGGHETETLTSSIFKLYDKEMDLEKVRKFYKRHPTAKDASKLRSDAISSIENRIDWIKERRDKVEEWFKKNVHMPWNNLRLPTHVTPISYNITLHPNISQGDFKGDVSIDLEISQSTDTIVFHQSGLAIADLKLLNSESGSEVEIDEEFPYKRNELHVVRLKEKIQGGRYVLQMKFAGKLAKDGRGMEKYQYTDKVTNEERHLLATMFEPNHARKVFPCFDEPTFKAKFRLSVVHQSNTTALSNMPESENIFLDDSLVQTVFQESTVMSTYLLFFAISDFEYLESNYKGKQVRFYAPSDRIMKAKHCLNLTVQIMEKLENYFGVPYSLPKLDSIVIPGYVVAGMEHWGAIAYTNPVLFNDIVVVHELVHQWIGNLVTLKWWSDLWLQEGLTSSLLMHRPIKDCFPRSEEEDVRERSQMMCLDSTDQSHPIVKNVSTPKEITPSFKALAYTKGSAVLLMLQHALKEDFQKGISAYLNTYAYQNAEAKDLWSKLSNATSLDLDVAEIMDTWTQQIGFPYVEVQIRGGTVQASQKWFVREKNLTAALQNAKKLHYAPYDLIWKIPLVYKNIRTGEEHTLWLENKNETFQINATSEDVFKFNPDFLGFYIVKYDSLGYAKLRRTLLQNHLDLSVSDRYNLLHDSFLLAESDRLSYDVPLRLSRYLERETSALPWGMFRHGTRILMKRLGTKSRKLLKAFITDVTSLAYDDNIAAIPNKTYFVNWQTFSKDCAYDFPSTDFMYVVIELTCKASNEKCVQTMSQELQQWMLGKESEVDLSLLFEVAIPHHGNETLWDFIHGELISSDNTTAKKRLMAKGLALFTDPQLIQKTIAAMAQDPRIETDLAQVLFKDLADNLDAAPLLWEYAKENWSPLMTRLKAKSDPSIGIQTFCEVFRTAEQLNEITEFMKTIPNEAKSISEKCTSEIQDKIKWSKENEEDISMWLVWNTNK